MSNKNIANAGGFIRSDINHWVSNQVKIEDSKYLHPSAGLMDKPPIPVTAYYHINREESMASPGDLNIKSLLGDDSPVRFDKIEGLLMYGFMEDLRRRDRDNVTGYKNIKRGASYIIGGVFEPFENDLFMVTMDNNDYIYQITSVDAIQDKDKPIYRITHMPYVSDQDATYNALVNLGKQVVRNMVYIPENIGTEWEVLVEKTVYERLMNRMSFIQRLQMEYLMAFYDKKMNTFLCKDRNDPTVRYYSDVLIEFLIKSDILYNKDMATNIVLTHEIKPKPTFEFDFDETTHGLLLRGERNVPVDTAYTIDVYQKGTLPFSFLEKYDFKYYNLSCDKDTYDIANNDPTFIKQVPFSDDSLFKKLQDNDMNIEELYKSSQNLSYRIKPYDLDAFMRIPIVLYYLIHKTENDITTRYNHFIADLLQTI